MLLTGEVRSICRSWIEDDEPTVLGERLLFLGRNRHGWLATMAQDGAYVQRYYVGSGVLRSASFFGVPPSYTETFFMRTCAKSIRDLTIQGVIGVVPTPRNYADIAVLFGPRSKYR